MVPINSLHCQIQLRFAAEQTVFWTDVFLREYSDFPLGSAGAGKKPKACRDCAVLAVHNSACSRSANYTVNG